jgi:hypothetical protein
MRQIENHAMRLLSPKHQIDVTLVDDNARIPAQQKSRQRRSAPEEAINKQERRLKSIMTQIGNSKDLSSLSAPKERPTEGYNTRCQLENHTMRLLSPKLQIDVTLVDDNARIPAQQRSPRGRSAPEGAINKQERRWKSIMTQIGDTKDLSPLSPPKRPTEDTFLSLPKRSSDE